MGALKFVLYIVLVISTLCIVSSVYMTSCNSTFIRKWDEHWIDVPAGGSIKASVTTARVHSPNKGGRFGKDDELQWRLSIEPSEGSFAPETLKFLDDQAPQHPELCFFDDQTSQRYVSIPLSLKAASKDGSITSYQDNGSVACHKPFGSASEWSIIWHSQARLQLPPQPSRMPTQPPSRIQTQLPSHPDEHARARPQTHP